MTKPSRIIELMNEPYIPEGWVKLEFMHKKNLLKWVGIGGIYFVHNKEEKKYVFYAFDATQIVAYYKQETRELL